MNLLRKLKRLVFSPEKKWRKIKFGIAKGCWFPIDRRSYLRIEFGLFELPLVKYFRDFSKKAKVAYDVGAEMGYYSLALTQLMGEGSRVYAFESNKERVAKFPELLKRNSLEDKIKVFEAYVTNRNDAENISIDSFVYKEGNSPPDLIKMDIEGEELNALKGAEKILKEHHPKLILEVHSYELVTQCQSFLRELGYAVQEVKLGWFNRLFPEARADGRNEYNGWLVAQKNN